jgi:hypothetical protein
MLFQEEFSLDWQESNTKKSGCLISDPTDSQSIPSKEPFQTVFNLKSTKSNLSPD